MSEENGSGSGGSCGCGGCVGVIIFILIFWAIWYGLPIGDKTWNIDIFPPRIWEMNAEPAKAVEPIKPVKPVEPVEQAEPTEPLASVGPTAVVEVEPWGSSWATSKW